LSGFRGAKALPFYDRLMHECFRGGLKTPHIAQEGVNEATILCQTMTFTNGEPEGRPTVSTCPELSIQREHAAMR
jgi:hypothetical protein